MNRPPLVIDTAAWVDVLRAGASGEKRDEAESALASGRAAMTAPVWVELYRGVRGKRGIEGLHGLRRLCRWLEFDETCWEQAAVAARQCRENGARVPLGDVLVFACARRHGAGILAVDRHSDLIARWAGKA